MSSNNSSNAGFVNSFGQTTSYISNLGSNSISIGAATANFPNLYSTLLSQVPNTIQVRLTSNIAFQTPTTMSFSNLPSFSPEALLSSFLGTYSKTAKFNGTWTPSTLAAAFRDYVNTRLTTPGALTADLSARLGDQVNSYQILSTMPAQVNLTSAVAADYSTKVNIASDFAGVLNPSPTDIANQASAWFGDFLANYPFASSGAGIVAADFFSNMGVFLATTAAVREDSVLSDFTSGTDPNQVAAYNSTEIVRYETVFNALFPTGLNVHTGQTFQQTLQAFYDSFYNSQTGSGYFNPSQAFGFWVKKMQTDYSAGPPLMADLTTLSVMGSEKTLVLNSIISSIKLMSDTIQDTALAQSNRLLTYNSWQQAYAKLSADVPVFRAGSPRPDAELDYKARGELNATVNAKHRAQIQSNQAGVSNDSKALMSQINQTNDAISQQSKFATAVIQLIRDIIKLLSQAR
jgi:hypothetical protein